MTEKDKLISNILIYFDFERCADVMQYLNWTWAGNPEFIPDKATLAHRATELLHEAYDKLKANKGMGEISIATGGLKASAWIVPDREEDVDTEIGLRLEFILEDFECDYK